MAVCQLLGGAEGQVVSKAGHARWRPPSMRRASQLASGHSKTQAHDETSAGDTGASSSSIRTSWEPIRWRSTQAAASYYLPRLTPPPKAKAEWHYHKNRMKVNRPGNNVAPRGMAPKCSRLGRLREGTTAGMRKSAMARCSTDAGSDRGVTFDARVRPLAPLLPG